MNKYLIAFLLFTSLSCWSQQLTTTTYRDLSIPYIEQDLSKYNFAYPIQSDIFEDSDFTPPTDGLYLLATYGHRYLSSASAKTDNHGGFDYWRDHTYNGITYGDSILAPIICMCDGFISEVLNGPDAELELTGTGRSVQVTCDSVSQAFGGTTRINYRHLSSLGPLATIADTAVINSIAIQKGDVIGIMGESGLTTNIHLHLSTSTIHPENGNIFQHTARIFDPTLHPAILKELTDAKIELLQDWSDSTLFRVTWPYNETINQFEFINQSDTVIFNKETAYDTGSAIRDNHDCLPDIDVYAYQFNGKRTAVYRYLLEMENIPARYPASPSRDTNLSMYGYEHIPITHDSVAFVYDFMVKNLSPSHDKDDFVIKLSDVWGYTVEGTFPTTTSSKELTSRDIKVYPNPMNDQLTIDYGHFEKKSVNLYDLFGRLIFSKTTSELSDTINFSDYSKGIYILVIESSDGIFSKKIIKG